MDNIIDFKTAKAGGSGNTTWIEELPEGTVFLFETMAQAHPSDVGCQQAHVMFKFKKATMLMDNLNLQENRYIVDNARFCRQMRLVEVLSRPGDNE